METPEVSSKSFLPDSLDAQHWYGINICHIEISKLNPFMMTEELSTKDDGLDPILAQDDKKALTVLTDLCET